MLRRCSLAAVVCALAAAAAPPGQQMRLSLPVWIEAPGPTGPTKFHATLNGRHAAVTAQLGPDSDQIILVVWDLTGDASYVDPARQALTDQISKLPRNTWAGLLSAQDGLRVLADPGPDRAHVVDGIANQSNSGNPGLLETVDRALHLAGELLHRSPVRVAVLYVTDSNIYRYREDYTNPVINQSDPHDLSRRFPEALVEEKFSRLLDAVGQMEAPLFVVHLHNRTDRLNSAYQNGLEALPEATGGRTEICRSIGEIPEAIGDVFARISSAWRLTLAVPPKVHGVAEVRLTAVSGSDELRASTRSRVEVGERQARALQIKTR